MTDEERAKLKDKDFQLMNASKTFMGYAVHHLQQASELVELAEFERALLKAQMAIDNIKAAKAARATVGTIKVD